MNKRTLFEQKYLNKVAYKRIRFNEQTNRYESGSSSECLTVDLINAFWKVWQDAVSTFANSE